MKKSIARSHVVRIIDGDDELKKHSSLSPEIQFKELNEKHRRTLPDQQINETMPDRAQTKSSQKLRNKKNQN